MKKLYKILIVLLVTASTFAQAPEKMSYQAVLRDASNTLLTSQEVGMQISMLQGSSTGTAVYTETHSVTTNINGLVSLEIGTGSTSDDFATIDWSAGTYFIKTETDPAGGTNYTITGTSQVLSVPFAMYAKTSGSSQADTANIDKNTTDIATNASGISTIETEQTTQNTAITLNTTAIALNTAKGGITSAQATTISNISGINTGDKTLADLGGLAENTAITAGTNTKITYDANGLVTAGADATTADIAASANKNYVTDAQATVLGNTSNTNTGDKTLADLGGLAENTAITAGTNTKITYDAKGLVTAGADATTADIAASANKNYVTDAQATTISSISHAIGDSYGGGIVFFVYDNGQHGLIAATTDQSAGIRWYGGSNTNTRARADGIGAGLKNTAIIIANQGPVDGNAFAATVCNEYSVPVGSVTYGAGYLPSKDELH
jgi:hypothetical protein